jgi:hypothetical protein
MNGVFSTQMSGLQGRDDPDRWGKHEEGWRGPGGLAGAPPGFTGRGGPVDGPPGFAGRGGPPADGATGFVGRGRPLEGRGGGQRDPHGPPCE